jgi:hypothetical protein
MTFKAYIDNIYAKTGKTPDDFVRRAKVKGYLAEGTLKPRVKAGEIVDWLKNESDLGRGHAMTIYMLLKSGGPTSAKKKSRL